ncbi:hypothetical protein ACQU0X_08725 [Pseudovibrio ascidiaceicola]|uniref:hypothetical protein n=1 Tax=Pseudovibrio ascidiaceicola TaxID=285279 RepID=UPI003D36237C
MSRYWLSTHLVVIGLALTSGTYPAHTQISVEPSLGTSGSVEPETGGSQDDSSMMSDMPEYQMSNPQDMPIPTEPATEPATDGSKQSSEDNGSFWSQFFE